MARRATHAAACSSDLAHRHSGKARARRLKSTEASPIARCCATDTRCTVILSWYMYWRFFLSGKADLMKQLFPALGGQMSFHGRSLFTVMGAVIFVLMRLQRP